MKILAPLDVTGNAIQNVPTPTAGTDGANKAYVDGRALPTGGTSGQVLSKSSATNYDAGWTTPAGSTAGLVGRAELLTNSVLFTSQFQDVLTLTVSLTAGAIYRVHYNTTWQASTPNSGYWRINLVDSVGSVTTTIGYTNSYGATSRVSVSLLYVPGTSGSRTFTLLYNIFSGPNITLLGSSTEPRQLWVERIG